VQVDAAVVLVTVCEESHWVSFFWGMGGAIPSVPGWYVEGEGQ